MDNHLCDAANVANGVLYDDDDDGLVAVLANAEAGGDDDHAVALGGVQQTHTLIASSDMTGEAAL